MKNIGITLSFLLLVNSANAQSPEINQAPSTKTAVTKSTASNDRDVTALRTRARALLISLSIDARSFREQTLRARSLARIADALWQVDSEQARLLFRKAWEAAELADQENAAKLQEEINRQKARTGGGFAINLPPNVRREVLKLSARHDRAVSEEFLERLKQQGAETANPTPRRSDPLSGRPDEALSQRLGAASELLKAGDTERALEFARPALTVVTVGTLDFLSDLREKNSNAADSLYAALLVNSATNPDADANTVSVLFSYIFSPHLYITFSGSGASSSQKSSTVRPEPVSAELRTTFFQSAASILLRPLPPPGQPDQSSSGLDGKYLVIKRLLPFFEQFAPAQMVEPLRGHLNALNAIVSDNARRRDDESIGKGLKPEQPAAEREQALLDRIDRVKTSADRDSLYIQLAFLASNKGDMRARDFVSKVEDSQIRSQLQVFIDSSLANVFVEKKLPDPALDLVRKGDLPHIHKAWVMTECAKILAKTDREKALELIDLAIDEARRLEPSDPALPRALFAVANAIKGIDRARVWEATFDAVKAANSAEGFTGEDGELVVKFQSKGQASLRNKYIEDFDLDGIFSDLALEHYDRAVELARGFQAEGPRAIATIAIAEAILHPKKGAASQ
ncbi:MAG TPA: hypothetical protein VJ875_02745 [Pyrinomonadaceae bacterium]|nr:hypothetical protein [Pyrinomonadaceae bacterium]